MNHWKCHKMSWKETILIWFSSSITITVLNWKKSRKRGENNRRSRRGKISWSSSMRRSRQLKVRLKRIVISSMASKTIKTSSFSCQTRISWRREKKSWKPRKSIVNAVGLTNTSTIGPLTTSFSKMMKRFTGISDLNFSVNNHKLLGKTSAQA